MVLPRLAWFRSRMIEKLALPKNQAKGDWRLESRADLFTGLLQEVAELAATDPADARAVALECADVANRAMMIADKARHDAKANTWPE